MKEEDRKIGPEIHCTDLKLSRNLSAHVRKSGVDEVTMMHGWIIRYLYENREQADFKDLMVTLKCLLFGQRDEVF